MEHDVGGLKVVMNDLVVELVHVLERADDLPDDLLGLLLFEALVLEKVLSEFGALAVLHDEAHLAFLHFDDLDQLGDVGVAEALLDLDLPVQVLQVVLLFLLVFGAEGVVEPVLLQRHKAHVVQVETLEHSAEPSAAQ